MNLCEGLFLPTLLSIQTMILASALMAQSGPRWALIQNSQLRNEIHGKGKSKTKLHVKGKRSKQLMVFLIPEWMPVVLRQWSSQQIIPNFERHPYHHSVRLGKKKQHIKKKRGGLKKIPQLSVNSLYKNVSKKNGSQDGFPFSLPKPHLPTRSVPCPSQVYHLTAILMTQDSKQGWLMKLHFCELWQQACGAHSTEE